MRLSDIMGAMQLSGYAEVALLLFVAAFGAIVFQVFSARKAEAWEAARRLPLQDDTRSTPSNDGAASRRKDSSCH